MFDSVGGDWEKGGNLWWNCVLEFKSNFLLIVLWQHFIVRLTNYIVLISLVKGKKQINRNIKELIIFTFWEICHKLFMHSCDFGVCRRVGMKYEIKVCTYQQWWYFSPENEMEHRHARHARNIFCEAESSGSSRIEWSLKELWLGYVQKVCSVTMYSKVMSRHILLILTLIVYI